MTHPDVLNAALARRNGNVTVTTFRGTGPVELGNILELQHSQQIGTALVEGFPHVFKGSKRKPGWMGNVILEDVEEPPSQRE